MKITNQQIYSLCKKLLKNIDKVLSHFQIEPTEYTEKICFPCPVHGGDNLGGCTIYLDGDNGGGNWSCWTRNCHEEYKNNLFGLIRGILSHNSGHSVNISDTFNFCLKLLGEKYEDIGYDYQTDDRSTDAKLMDIFEREPRERGLDLTREQIRESLEIPANYFVNRGYEPETLDFFDVGLCSSPDKPMSNRIVVPVYDANNAYVGCIGRALHSYTKPKWINSAGFKKSEFLYGLNIAKQYIMNSRSAFLVEGQGDVWRMHEAGIKNTVGIFGASLSEDQLVLLEKSGAMKLYIATDSDEAGQKAASQIAKRGGRRFNYQRINISEKDVGDMTIEQIKNEILSQL